MPRRSPRTQWVSQATLGVCLAIPMTVFAQAQPQYPTQLPVPKTAPAPAPGQAESPPRAAGQAQPAQPAAPATPPAAPAAPAGPVSPGGRDPFDPLVTKAPPGEEGRAQTLSGLKLVGVVWDPANRDQIRALVETPDGLGYYVRLNEEKFGGKVIAIDRDRVRFSVRERDPGGQTRTRTVELKLSGQ